MLETLVGDTEARLRELERRVRELERRISALEAQAGQVLQDVGLFRQGPLGN